nr:zinc finger, CCHC-type [Tanacetum cinerariifolium]
EQEGIFCLGYKVCENKFLGVQVRERQGIHRVYDEKHVWFEVKLYGAQEDREAEVFQVSNNDIVVTQRWLKDKQAEEKTNTDCLSEVAKHLGVAGILQQNGLVNDTKVAFFAKVRCFLIQSGLSKIFWAEDTTRSAYLVNRSPSSATRFKEPIDMLGFIGWLASIKQGILRSVKVVLYRNMGFNKSGDYKKTFIGFSVGTGSMQVLQGVEFEVEPQEDHTFEVEPHRNVNHVDDSQEVQTQDLIDYQLARDREQHLAYELFGDGYYWGYTPVMFIHLFLYIDDMVFSCGCKAEIWATKGLLDKAKRNILGIKIVRDQSGYTLRVSQSRFYKEKLEQTLLEGHSILSLKGNLSGDCDVEKNGKWSCIYAVGTQEYQMVCTILDIAFADVESRYELRLVAGIATGALVKGGSRSEVPTQFEVATYRTIESSVMEVLTVDKI